MYLKFIKKLHKASKAQGLKITELSISKDRNNENSIIVTSRLSNYNITIISKTLPIDKQEIEK